MKANSTKARKTIRKQKRMYLKQGMLVTIIKMIMMMTMMNRPYISMAVIQPLVGGRFVLSTKPKPTVTTASTWRTRRERRMTPWNKMRGGIGVGFQMGLFYSLWWNQALS